MNPLNNHRQSLILGVVIAVVLTLLIGGFNFNELGLARWFHIVAGVFWIGLLYYFNVAQTPALADAAADKGGPGGAGITKYVAPRALFYCDEAGVLGAPIEATRNFHRTTAGNCAGTSLTAGNKRPAIATITT